MKSVEFYDWKLDSGKPFSYLLRSYPDSCRHRVADMHSALHLGLVLRGECTGVFTGETLRSTAGNFYLTAPWEPHYTVSTAKNNELLLLNIDRESLQSSFFTGGSRLEMLFLMPPGKRMAHLNTRLHRSGAAQELAEMLQQPEGMEKDLRFWNLILKLFILALPEAEPAAEPSGNYRRLLPALKALSGKLLGVEDAAARCNLSSGYFSVLFKKQFGMSFGQYERDFRLNGAAAALRQGESLKTAADSWGLCDKSHLARLLKKRRDNGNR